MTKEVGAIPPDVRASIEAWKKVNPGYKHVLYDDADIKALILEKQPWLEVTCIKTPPCHAINTVATPPHSEIQHQ